MQPSDCWKHSYSVKQPFWYQLLRVIGGVAKAWYRHDASLVCNTQCGWSCRNVVNMQSGSPCLISIGPASSIQLMTKSLDRRPSLTITEPPFCNWALFDFSCTFPVLSSLWNYWDMGEMTLILCINFYLKVFSPLFIVILQNVLDWPFCKFVVTCRAAEFKVRLPWSRVRWLRGHAVSLEYRIQSTRTYSSASERCCFGLWDFRASLCFPLIRLSRVWQGTLTLAATLETAWTQLSGSNAQYWLASWRSSSVQSFLQ